MLNLRLFYKKMNIIEKYNKLKVDWNNFKSNPDNKKIRIKDAAEILSTNEAALLSTEIGEKTYFLKISNFDDFFIRLSKIDKLMFLIRSQYVVHETTIIPSQIKCLNNKLILNNTPNYTLIDYDIGSFEYVFYDQKKHSGRTLKSFQFFNQFGTAVLKVYLRGKKDLKFNQIADMYNVNYSYELQREISSKPTIRKFSDFYYSEYGINNNFVKKIDYEKNFLRKLLELLTDSKIPIRIHAFGENIFQQFSGKVKKLIDFGPWINIMDKNFNLHVLENKIIKSTLSQLISNENELWTISFIDINNYKVLEFGPIEGFEDKFKILINKLR